jgi:hypothetical protein
MLYQKMFSSLLPFFEYFLCSKQTMRTCRETRINSHLHYHLYNFFFGTPDI